MRNRLRPYWRRLWRSRSATCRPAGAVPSPSEGGPDQVGFVWEGREHDAEARLQYNRARFYDSTAGRWTSQDPLGYESGDGNLYPYARPPEAGPPAPDAAGRPPQP